MRSQALRQCFLTFFENKQHIILPSSSLVPERDDSLLFTNAGMVPFKEIFLGHHTVPYTRATTVQKCVRAGGKHNDLGNVGYTARHHTFFEMMGNFSFGDYFKKEAILYAWTFLTQELALDPKRLWVTVYEEDSEAERIWLEELRVDKDRFSRCGEQDNFWAMGDTGPCGPCTEIYYDHGDQIPGMPPGIGDPGDRFVEIWNLVFMQFYRDESGQLSPLPKPSVDTGMGLERIAAVMQGVHDNYESDLFVPLIQAAKDLLGIEGVAPRERYALRVLADHIRAATFLIADGVGPTNEGRGYVLRRIMRRALRYGHQLGAEIPFFYQLVSSVIREMREAYPSLEAKEGTIVQVIQKEERQFAHTLSQGLQVLERALAGGSTVLTGEIAFKLYDTYGFPVDLTADVAKERGVALDLAGFQQAMDVQRERARGSHSFQQKGPREESEAPATPFTGHHTLEAPAQVQALFYDGEKRKQLQAGEEGGVVLVETPFYAEGGGQVGDTGEIQTSHGVFRVQDTQKQGASIVHWGVLETGVLGIEDRGVAKVSASRRAATARNHSATHLLHATLRDLLGTQVQQKGSLVTPERLRFDFTYPMPLTEVQIHTIESRVNEKIWENTAVKVSILSPDEAIAQGAVALFGEKYGDTVRMLDMGEGYSIELCGGTHVVRTGDIGPFKIVSEESVASGVRRIEALTGQKAFQWIAENEKQLRLCMQLFQSNREQVAEKGEQLVAHSRALEKENEKLKEKIAQEWVSSHSAERVGDLQVFVKRLPDNMPLEVMRRMMDVLKDRLEKAIIVLATVCQEKVQLLAGVSSESSVPISSVEIVRFFSAGLGAKGGGRFELAQAGGGDPTRLDQELEKVKGWLEKKIFSTSEDQC